jgi:photosystem II stability/assembly factor-like uncharacterized protein
LQKSQTDYISRMEVSFKNRLLITVLLLSCILGACNKDKITLQTQEIQTPTSDDLNTVFFVDVLHGFAAGGTKYDRGILVKTNDGGQNWSSADSVGPKAIYTSHFFTAEKGFIGAYDSHLGYTTDSGKSFSDKVFNYIPIRGLAFFDTQNGVFAAGTNYSDGSWAVTHDGGMHWAESPLQIHSFRCVDYADAQNVCVGGYGTLLHSGDGGDHFDVVKKEGDFYTGLQFMNDSRGVAVGYQGEILLTTDKGLSWRKVKSINQPFESQDHFLSISFFDAQHGYAVGESGLVMRTTDGGESWKRVKTFTDKSLRAVQLLTATSGVIVAEGGKVFLFKE